MKEPKNVRTLPLRDQDRLLQLRRRKGWAQCNGQFLPINQNQALFSLLGTTYGGNGQTTFALPNLRGRVPIHFGGSHNLGEAAGSTSVTINIQQLPTHLHQLHGAQTDVVLPDAGPQDPTNGILRQAPGR